MDVVPGWRGYAEKVDELGPQYEALSFDEVHAAILHLLPEPGARVLDVGAGTGRDACALAERGFRVTAVEPTNALRDYGQCAHPQARIRWVDDSLPHLVKVRRDGRRFDLILLAAVWMHLDVEERRSAMSTLAGLLARPGRLAMTLRHGPPYPDRRMFAVSPRETVALANRWGLRVMHRDEPPDLRSRKDVRWTSLVFERAD